jgi:uncharacterized delta-60 repeat protein
VPPAAAARPAPPDRPFGGRDGVVYPVRGDESDGRAVAILPSGRIVAAGYTRERAGEGFVAVRLSPRGRVERRRIVRFPEAPYAGAVDLVLTRGGRLLLAGVARDELGVGRVAVARLRPTMAPDPAFGVAGRALGPPVHHTLDVRAMALDRVGRIVVASTVGYPTRMLVTRFLPDGSPDGSFGTAGTWTRRGAAARALATTRRGEVLVAGRAPRRRGRRSGFVLARLSARGVLRSFDVRRLGRGTGTMSPVAVLARRDGSAWVAGAMSKRRGRRTVLLRYGRRGRLRTVRRLGLPPNGFIPVGLVRRRDGRLLLGGMGTDRARWTFYGLTRNGRRDPRYAELTSRPIASFGEAVLHDFATRGRRIVAVGTDEEDQRIDFNSYLIATALRITRR